LTNDNNKDYLSQEEIDALLKQTGESSDPFDFQDFSGFGDVQSPSVDDYLTPLEQDALGEIGNITYGTAATALSTLLGKKVEITTPKVSAIARAELESEFPKPHVAVNVKYIEGFTGINLLVIQTRDAKIIADLMMGGDGLNTPEELSELHISAVQEAMNQMMGSSATSMSTIFNRFINISPPGIDILDLNDGGTSVKNLPPGEVFIKISFRLIIGDLIDSNIMQLLTVDFAKSMVSSLIGDQSSYTAPPQQAAPPIRPETIPAPKPEPVYQEPPAAQPQHYAPPEPPRTYAPPQPAYQDPWQQPQQPYPQQPMYAVPPQMPPQMPAPPQGGYGTMTNRNVNVQPAQFAAFGQNPFPQPDESNLSLLLDIPLKVTVELGRTNKMIKDILELSQGSIIELDKLAGEPVDILVNNKFIAKGEVVVIDENFGVRVTDIVNQWDRIQKLQ
jgi:flagellar motor switch protein FliN/FliY